MSRTDSGADSRGSRNAPAGTRFPDAAGGVPAPVGRRRAARHWPAAAAVLSATLPAASLGAPCDTLPPDAAYTAPPHTVEALKETLLPGLATILRVASPVDGQFHREVRVLARSDEDVTLLERGHGSGVPADARGAREYRLTWEELRDYGCFPADSASRRRATVDTAFGPMDGWEYERLGEAGRQVLFFADLLPGLPVLSARYEQSMLAIRLEQVWRSDKADAGDGAAPQPRTPASPAAGGLPPEMPLFDRGTP